MESKHPWKARLVVGIVMLALAFLGMVLTNIKSTGNFDYWKWVIPVFAILAIWLSWYIKRSTEVISPITLGHEIVHWLGLIGAVFIVSFYEQVGIMSRFIAGLFNLTLLSLTVFIAGIYIESTFLVIGIILGIFAILAAFIVQYLFAFLIPIIIAGILLILLILWISHKRQKSG